jgi:hypothetical protein
MKKIMIAALASMACATPAFANSTSSTSDITIGANVQVQCSITGLPAAVTFGNLTNTGASGVVTKTGIAVFCNQSSTVSATSDDGYLKAVVNNPANDSIDEDDFTSGANPGFAAGVDYRVTVPSFAPYGGPYSADTSDLDADVPETLSNVPALNNPNVTLQFQTIEGTLPLLGTNYSDKLTISITATGV